MTAKTFPSHPVTAADAIGFLRSCIRSGEKLSAEDDAAIDAVLDALAAEHSKRELAALARDAEWLGAIEQDYEARANVFRMTEVECQRKVKPLQALVEQARAALRVRG